MTEVLNEERQDELTFPATLPVLPLKETVVFPGFVSDAGFFAYVTAPPSSDSRSLRIAGAVMFMMPSGLS